MLVTRTILLFLALNVSFYIRVSALEHCCIACCLAMFNSWIYLWLIYFVVVVVVVPHPIRNSSELISCCCYMVYFFLILTHLLNSNHSTNRLNLLVSLKSEFIPEFSSIIALSTSEEESCSLRQVRLTSSPCFQWKTQLCGCFLVEPLNTSFHSFQSRKLPGNKQY